jgi:surface protein
MESAKQSRILHATTVQLERHALPQELFPSILSHWDVATLMDKKRVCQDWNELCTDAIDAKRKETTKKALSTKDELQTAVKKYCWYNKGTGEYSQLCSPKDAEDIATTFGWPINKWDVSSNQDFSNVFASNIQFNQDIASWNVSNATSMRGMFFKVKDFNRDMSSWDVSNVTDMSLCSVML